MNFREPRESRREERREERREGYIDRMKLLEAIFRELERVIDYEPPMAKPVSTLFSTVASTLLALENSITNYSIHQIEEAIRSSLKSVIANYAAQTVGVPPLNPPYDREGMRDRTLPGASPSDYQGGRISPPWYRDRMRDELTAKSEERRDERRDERREDRREEFQEGRPQPKDADIRDAERRTGYIREESREIGRETQAVDADLRREEDRLRREKEELKYREEKERERERDEREREERERDRERGYRPTPTPYNR